MDIVSGNVASYSRCFNSDGNLEKIKELLELSSVLEAIQEERVVGRSNAAKRKKADNIEKDAKRLKKTAAYDTKQMDLMPGMISDVEKGKEWLVNLPRQRLIEIIRYYYNYKEEGLSKLKKDEIVSVIMKLYEPNQIDVCRNDNEKAFL